MTFFIPGFLTQHTVWQLPGGWLCLLSESVIALAYYGLPLFLMVLVMQRRDMPFRPVLWFLGAVVVACGAAHLLETWTLWRLNGWVSEGLKFVTALLSLAIAVLLWQALPQTLSLPSATVLETANERLREAQRLARLGNWEFDLQTQVRQWSEELYLLLGLDPQTPVPDIKTMYERFTADSQEQLRQAIGLAASEGVSFAVEVEYKHSDGRLRWFQTQGKALRNKAGKVVKLVGTFQDINDRKQAEIALQESESRFQSFMSHSPAAAWITDAAGHLLYRSQTYSRLFQIADDAIGKSIFTLFKADIAEQFQRNIQQVAATQQVVEVLERAPRPDGSVGEFLVYKFPLPQPDGSTHVGGIGVDVTEREQVKAQLRDLSQRLTLALKSGAIGMWDWDVVHDVLRWDNRVHELYGTDPLTFQGKHSEWARRLQPDDLQLVEVAIAQALAGQKDYEVEFRVLLPNGMPRFLKSHALVERNAQGEPQRMVGINYDISERKQAEVLIHQSLKEKEVLLQEIHHRVKNNLQIVYSLLRLQRRQLRDKQAAAALLESQSRVEAIALVHEKLYQAGDLAHINAAEYITGLVSNLVETYSLQEKQVEVQFEVAPLALGIDQAIPCGLILNELISNVLKYAFPHQEQGRLTVQLYATTAPTPHSDSDACTCSTAPCELERVTLVVADNGVGLPLETRVGKDAQTLGLQLVSDFTAQLKGTLQIESCPGACFKVQFPLRPSR